VGRSKISTCDGVLAEVKTPSVLLRMAVACGPDFTVVQLQEGGVGAWGQGDWGQLGLESKEYHPLPVAVGGCEVFGGMPIVMVAAGSRHSAGVAADG